MRIKINSISDKKGYSQKTITGTIIKGTLKEGSVYELQEFDEYTDKQRKLFEPLCRAYFDSLCCPREVGTWEELRDDIKRSLGQGYERIRYVDDNYKIVTIKYKDKKSIPKSVIIDWERGNKARVELILRSTTSYTKKQFMSMTDSLIREMIMNGVLISKKGKWFASVLEEIDFVE